MENAPFGWCWFYCIRFFPKKQEKKPMGTPAVPHPARFSLVGVALRSNDGGRRRSRHNHEVVDEVFSSPGPQVPRGSLCINSIEGNGVTFFSVKESNQRNAGGCDIVPLRGRPPSYGLAARHPPRYHEQVHIKLHKPYLLLLHSGAFYRGKSSLA